MAAGINARTRAAETAAKAGWLDRFASDHLIKARQFFFRLFLYGRPNGSGDFINLLNRSQMSGPDLNPTSTNFGRITSQTSSLNRFVQIQARLQF